MTAFVERRDILSWGQVIRGPQRAAEPAFKEDVAGLVASRNGASLLAAGLRRSYGDSMLNTAGNLILMDRQDRFIAADYTTGVVVVEAGVTLGEIMRRAVPHGWFVPVTPGTRFVTVGGAIANDVHGKNHHTAGTFGRYVRRIGLVRGDGVTVTLTPGGDNGLFAATIGGLGLTGVVVWAEIALQRISSAYLDVELTPFANVNNFWDLAEGAGRSHEHTVAWIDCTASGNALGRGIFSRACWSGRGGLVPHRSTGRLSVPFELPRSLLDRYGVYAFNALYFSRQKAQAGRLLHQHYSTFFHPLDSIGNWNRLYGRCGFWQYQCAIPTATMKDAIRAILVEISKSGQGSSLAVLKTFGTIASPGLMSFPMPGATLALDFSNRGKATLALFERLDSLVAEAGGRLYAAKDGRLPADMWRRGYPRLEDFCAHVDPAFGSDFWKRVCV